MTDKTYEKLAKQGRYVGSLEAISQLLDWDQETMMPIGAAEFRGEELKNLAGIIHKEKTSKKISGPLGELIDLKTGEILAKDFSPRLQKALKEWRRDYIIETALPKKFVEDLAKLTSEAIVVWRNARANNQYSTFAPYLKKMIAMNRKKADYIGYKDHPYDALLDLYEPGMTSATLTRIFDDLKNSNVELLNQITRAPQVDDKALYGDYPEAKQMEFCKKLLDLVGYDPKYGRLDLSTHPFSSGAHPTDSRITTRLQKDYIFSCISTVLHEAGHALYAMGLPAEEFGTPLGGAVSMGIHESQSRFWETRIGLTKPFVSYILPILQKEFPSLLHVTTDYCYRGINKVEPSFIRVEADEVTYPLHVILRFEMEKAFIEGSLNVKDIPAVWNTKMESFLGITPPDDAKGCLQDIHWSMGGIGYFPTYALGNLYAAAIFNKFAALNPDWEDRVSKGDLLFIRHFLHDNVYKYGREYRSQELVEKITGKPFTATDYIEYLKKKYSGIYQFNAAMSSSLR